MAGSFLMFHWVRGVPFEFNAGAYDNLNMWEQIDSGDQYTPAKKFLLSVPIILFLVSTHYTHYDITYFMINFMATLAVVVPKLPAVSLPGNDFENPLLTTLTASPYAHRSFQPRRGRPMIHIIRIILFLSQVVVRLGPAFLDQRYQIILLHLPEKSNEQITGSSKSSIPVGTPPSIHRVSKRGSQPVRTHGLTMTHYKPTASQVYRAVLLTKLQLIPVLYACVTDGSSR
jgi:hypothetical protein